MVFGMGFATNSMNIPALTGKVRTQVKRFSCLSCVMYSCSALSLPFLVSSLSLADCVLVTFLLCGHTIFFTIFPLSLFSSVSLSLSLFYVNIKFALLP